MKKPQHIPANSSPDKSPDKGSDGAHAPKRPVDAVGIICFRGDDVLLIQRGKAPRKGEWSIPGGRIEPQESEQSAALRELWEETGIKAKLIDKIAVIDADFGTHYYRLHDYLALWESGTPRAGDDAIAAKFVSPHMLAKTPLWDKTRQIIAQARTRLNTELNS